MKLWDKGFSVDEKIDRFTVGKLRIEKALLIAVVNARAVEHDAGRVDHNAVQKFVHVVGTASGGDRKEPARFDVAADRAAVLRRDRAGMIEQRAVQIAENCRFVRLHGIPRCASVRCKFIH